MSGVVLKTPLALEQLKERLAYAARGAFLPELGARVGAAILKEIADEFRQSRNPYGVAWAPVFRNRRRDRVARARRAKAGKPVKADKPLIDSGRLRASPVARMVGTNVHVALPVDYASYHQLGTKRIQRRQILPEDETGGLGTLWTLAITRESNAVMEKMLKG